METRKFKLEKSFKKVLNESEINRYEVFHPYEGFEADVGFWYGEYCRDVDAGLNNPDVGITEYIAEKIDEEHPTESPEQFKSLVRLVRETYPKAEKKWSANIRESRVGGPAFQMIKNSFWHKKEFWEQKPKLANAVSNLLFGFNAFDED